MPQVWSGWVVLTTVLTITAIGALIWKKKRARYVKVGHVTKLYFFPIKSLRGIEVTEGKCTKQGFEVNGLLDRSFMLLSGEDAVTQSEAPTLALLRVKVIGEQLIVSGPDVDSLTVDIKASPSANDKIVKCLVACDASSAIDCGDEVSEWFQSYLKMPNVRLVRFFPTLSNRKYMKNHPFYAKIKKTHSIGFQEFAAFHMLSQPSIIDLNSKIGEEKISALNFRPNIVVDGCAPYAEDSWKYMKFSSGVEMVNVLPNTRCLITTIEPDTGIMTQKEPLVTMRKYRIPKDPDLLKKTGSLPCLGTGCFVLKGGEIKLNDDIFAVVTNPLEMVTKSQM